MQRSIETPIRSRFLTVALIVLCAASQAAAQTTAIYSPADRGSLEGSASTSYPLGRHDSRFQQMFADLGPARLLSEHAYRRDALTSRGDIAAFRTSLEIRMSIAPLTPGAASRTFAKNAGSSVSTVLPKTSVSFPKTRRPNTVPGPFELAIPYKTSFAWPGQGTLCLDLSIDSNQVGAKKGVNFSASLDAQVLYASGRNVQPGYPLGQGCPAPGRTAAARVAFEVLHLGKRIDLRIDAKNGMPNTATTPTQSALLLSPDAVRFPWPPGTKCTLFGSTHTILLLAGNNTSAGSWSGVVPVGLPPTPGFAMFGQILSYGTTTGPSILSNAARLIAPPAGRGLVSSRIVSASDRTRTTGTVSFSVPVTRFR